MAKKKNSCPHKGARKQRNPSNGASTLVESSSPAISTPNVGSNASITSTDSQQHNDKTLTSEEVDVTYSNIYKSSAENELDIDYFVPPAETNELPASLLNLVNNEITNTESPDGIRMSRIYETVTTPKVVQCSLNVDKSANTVNLVDQSGKSRRLSQFGELQDSDHSGSPIKVDSHSKSDNLLFVNSAYAASGIITPTATATVYHTTGRSYSPDGCNYTVNYSTIVKALTIHCVHHIARLCSFAYASENEVDRPHHLREQAGPSMARGFTRAVPSSNIWMLPELILRCTLLVVASVLLRIIEGSALLCWYALCVWGRILLWLFLLPLRITGGVIDTMMDTSVLLTSKAQSSMAQVVTICVHWTVRMVVSLASLLLFSSSKQKKPSTYLGGGLDRPSSFSINDQGPTSCSSSDTRNVAMHSF